MGRCPTMCRAASTAIAGSVDFGGGHGYLQEHVVATRDTATQSTPQERRPMTDGESSPTGRPLLATKLHAPRRRPGVVQRQRLSDRLAAATGASVTLVSAPAGFGKTTLLAEWFCAPDDEGSATPWLSLDAGDNDPAVFWTYAIAAIQRAAPQVGASALASLQSSQPLTSVVAALLNDLYDLADRVVVVLDDYHVIDSADIHESIAFLIDHAPPHVPPRARQQIRPSVSPGPSPGSRAAVEIRAADLRFTARRGSLVPQRRDGSAPRRRRRRRARCSNRGMDRRAPTRCPLVARPRRRRPVHRELRRRRPLRRRLPRRGGARPPTRSDPIVPAADRRCSTA